MWPFSSVSSGSGSTSNNAGKGISGSNVESQDTTSMEVPQGADGIARDVPAIAYTEKVIAEKEASLRRYIQDNYSKLHAVEKELEALQLEVKLTSGSKKAAMELLRKKIEESGERIKVARTKEQEAKLAWLASQKLLEQEEEYKQNLCDDLKTMIQESALQQYEKLESLTRKLDALNPEMKDAAMSAIEGLRARIAPHGVPVLNGLPSAPVSEAASASTKEADSTTATSEDKATTASEVDDCKGKDVPTVAPESSKHKPDRVQEKAVHLKGQGGRGRGGRLVAKNTKGGNVAPTQLNGAWTGAGFDVDGQS